MRNEAVFLLGTAMALLAPGCSRRADGPMTPATAPASSPSASEHGPSTSRPAPPRGGFVPAEIDLGVRTWFEQVPFELTFVNEGDREIEIREVGQSCACAAAEGIACGVRVPPRRDIRMRGHVRGTGREGLRRESVWLVDAEGIRYDARIRLIAVRSFEVVPTFVQLRGLSGSERGAAASREVALRLMRGRPNGDPVSDATWADASLAALGEGIWRLVVSVNADALPCGISHGAVHVPLAGSDLDWISIPIQAERECVLRCAPPRVFLRPGETAIVQVYRTDGESVEILDMQGQPPVAAVVAGPDMVILSAGSATADMEEIPIMIRDRDGTTSTLCVEIVE